MFSINTDAKDIEKILGKFSQSKIDAISVEIVQNLGSIVKNSARNYVAVDTGALKGSIDMIIEGDGASSVAIIGTPLDYASSQEYGTSKQSGQPFLRPALQDARTASNDVMKAVVKKHA